MTDEKSILEVEPHRALPGHRAVVVRWKGKMVGVVYGADAPGIRFLSTSPLSVFSSRTKNGENIIEITTTTPKKGGN
jgi:hypothetical protein